MNYVDDYIDLIIMRNICAEFLRSMSEKEVEKTVERIEEHLKGLNDRRRDTGIEELTGSFFRADNGKYLKKADGKEAEKREVLAATLKREPDKGRF